MRLGTRTLCQYTKNGEYSELLSKHKSFLAAYRENNVKLETEAPLEG